MNRIRRESNEEKRIRSMDACEIVDENLDREDLIEALTAALEEVEPLLDLVNGSFGGGLTMTFTGSDAEDIETALSSVRKAISKVRF